MHRQVWIEFIETPLGRLSVILDHTWIYEICFNERDKALIVKESESHLGYELKNQLKAYFYGVLKEFSLPLMLTGTSFQQKVWQGLKRIPYGQTLSYKSFAESVGHPLAYRAVGSANGANVFPILLPCHRVIAAGGGLGGYSGGIERKQWLLDHEQKHFKD